ncbi:DUF3857 domain-containing protein [Psychroflexus sediminis]|uniref:DUF3857 domain-containing protein n=1 Tax=Psychroflexus sediminis TaxID=470826 RepID=A0A1G7V3A9_9FLAO|nr:DUF3857 domain-containing protein [Psychroflexus sediminis]SDG54302.1 protein of unknown function [Psychroflexus sediminis]
MKNIFLTLSLFFFSFFYAQKDYSIANLNLDLLKKSNSVIISQDIHLEIDSYSSMTITEDKLITILNKKGLSALDAFAHYDKSTKIKNLTLTVYNTFGAELQKFKERDFTDVSVAGSVSLYTDNRVKYLDYIPSSYPITVHFEKQVKTSNTAFIKSFRPIQNYDQTIKESTFKIENNSGEILRSHPNEYSEAIKMEQLDENTVLYSIENLESIPREVYSPSLETYTPQIMFALNTFELEGQKGQASSWKDFGKWQYENLLKGQDELSESTVSEIKSLTSHLQSDAEKAEVVYDYVQNNTRYISVQIGLGGWKPIPAEEVDEKKYGDCKGLTNYTKALLSAVGVESIYCVVTAGDEIINIEEEFSSMQGNHVILTIPQENEENIWLECTSQDIPFDFLGTFTDNRRVLALTPDGGKIIKTPAYDDEVNFQKTEAKINIQNRDIIADVEIKTKGTQYDSRYSIADRTEKDIRSYYLNYFDNIKQLNLTDYRFQNNKEKIVFTESLKVVGENYVKIYGNDLILDVNPFNKFQVNLPQYATRKTPFVIERGFVDEDEFVFNTEGLALDTELKDIEFDSDFGSYRLSFSLNEDKLVVKRYLNLKKNNYDKSSYEDFVEFFSTISKFDNTKVSFKKV